MNNEDNGAVERTVQHSERFIRHNLPRFVAAREFGAYGVLMQFEIIHAAKTSLVPDLFDRFCTLLRAAVGTPEIVPGSPEVEAMCKFGERSEDAHISMGQSAGSAKLYLVTHASDEEFEKYIREAASYSQVDVNDLRERFVRSYPGRG